MRTLSLPFQRNLWSLALLTHFGRTHFDRAYLNHRITTSSGSQTSNCPKFELRMPIVMEAINIPLRFMETACSTLTWNAVIKIFVARPSNSQFLAVFGKSLPKFRFQPFDLLFNCLMVNYWQLSNVLLVRLFTCH